MRGLPTYALWAKALFRAPLLALNTKQPWATTHCWPQGMDPCPSIPGNAPPPLLPCCTKLCSAARADVMSKV